MPQGGVLRPIANVLDDDHAEVDEIDLELAQRRPSQVPQTGLSASNAVCFSESPLPSKPPLHRPAGVKGAAEVKAELDRQRPSASRRGYGPRWRRARAAYLARHPLCVRCQAAGCIEPSTVVDHTMPHRGDAGLFWDEGNWAATCKRCHDAKTAREGRWG